jgi:hypothetical protein
VEYGLALQTSSHRNVLPHIRLSRLTFPTASGAAARFFLYHMYIIKIYYTALFFDILSEVQTDLQDLSTGVGTFLLYRRGFPKVDIKVIVFNLDIA